MSTVERFQAAVDVIRGLPKQGSFQPSSDMQLKFYSFYKQATEGPCRNPKPSFWDIVGKAKWDAWKSLGTMPKEEAMEKYVDELKEVIQILKKEHDNGNTAYSKDKIVETMSYTDSVSKFLDLLGPFYESVPLDQNQTTVNGDHGAIKDEEVVGKPTPVPYSKGQRHDSSDGAHVNGFGEPGELDSDGDEFSDTYDNIKEPLEDMEGDLTSYPVRDGGGGVVGDGGGCDSVSQTAPNSQINFREYSEHTNSRTHQDSSYTSLNSAHRSNGHCLQDSPARHSHPTTSPNHNHILLNHDHSYSQPILFQENENHIWALSREEVASAVQHFKGGDVDGIVQARGGSDQALGPINTRVNSAGSSGTSGTNVAGRSIRNRLARDGGAAQGEEHWMGAGGSGENPGGPQQSSGAYSDVSDQLALAVIKLQHSMDDVNSRLASLETTLKGPNLTQKSPQKKNVGHLFGISPQLLLLILAWPFLAQWIIYLIRKRRQQ